MATWWLAIDFKKYPYHRFGIASISISILTLIIIMSHIHFAYKLLATSTSTPNWLEIARFSDTLRWLTVVSCFVAFIGAILGLIALIKSMYHHAPIILTLFWFVAFLGNLGLVLLGFGSLFIGFRM